MNYRIILCVSVVFIHYSAYEWNFTIPSSEAYALLKFVFVDILARMAVPMFFLLSGYYFFKTETKLSSFTKHDYYSKLKKRIWTLLIPYLLWNIIAAIPVYEIAIYFFRNIPFEIPYTNAYDIFWVSPSYIGVHHEGAFSGIGNLSYPQNMPLWFIRDLMVVIVLTPILHILLLKTPKSFFTFLLSCAVFNVWPNITGFSYDAILYFSIGACISIHNKSLLEIAQKFKKYNYIISGILFSVLSYTTINKCNIHIISYISYLSLGMSLYNIICLLMTNNIIKPHFSISSSVFFIYCIHNTNILTTIIKIPIDKIIWSSITTNSLVLSIIAFFIYPIIIFFICILVHRIMMMIIPRITKVLNGNR